MEISERAAESDHLRLSIQGAGDKPVVRAEALELFRGSANAK